jgi:PAS domain S-box-containing protein
VEKNVPSREQLIREVEKLRSRLEHLENLNRDHQGFKEALRNSEAKFGALFQASPLAVFSLDSKGRIALWSPAAQAIYGWSAEEVIGKTIPFITEATRQDHTDLLKRAMSGEVISGLEIRRHRKDGTPIDIRLFTAPLRDDEGAIRGVMYLNEDITNLKRVDEALEVNLIIENSPAVLFRWKAEEGWPVATVSRNVKQFGYTPEELFSGTVTFADMVHPEDLGQVSQEVQEYSAKNIDRFRQEYRIVTKEGEVRWVDDRTVIERDPQGRIVAYQGLIIDRTESKQAEKILAESEQRFRLLAEATLDAMAITAQEEIVDCNEQMEGLLGLTRADLLGKSIMEFIVPEHQTLGAEAQRTGQQDFYELIMLTPGRTQFPVRMRCRTMEIDGRPVCITAINDITEERRVEEALHTAHEQLRAIIDSSSVAIVALDTEGLVTLWNHAAESIFGWKENEVLGRELPTIPEGKLEEHRGIRRRIIEGEPLFKKEVRRQRKDGSPVDILISAVPLRDLQGRIIGLMSEIVDVTEQKRAEAALQESELRFHQAFERAPIPMGITLSDGRREHINPAFIATFGYTLDEIPTVSTWVEQAYPDPVYRRQVLEEWDRRMAKAKEENRPMKPYEVNITCKDGTVRNIEVLGAWMENRLLVFFNDITERKRAEVWLKESEERFSSFMRFLPGFAFVRDHNRRILYVNDIFYTAFGKPEEGWLGRVNDDFWPGDMGEKIRQDDENVLATGKAKAVIEEVLIGDGNLHTFHTIKFPIPRPDGPAWLGGIAVDITDLRRAEDELERERERLKQASFYGRVALWQWNFKEGTLEWSDFVDNILGYDRGEFPRTLKGWFEHIHPEDQNLVKEELSKHFSGQSTSETLDYISRMRRKDGTYIWWHNVGRISSVAGQVISMSGACSDITKQKEAEQVILASLKEKEILLQEVHHRVKNNLQIITSLLDLHSGDIQKDSVQAIFNESKKRIMTIALIHERLYRSEDFARVDIARYTENLLDSLMQSYGEAASVDVSLDIHDLYLDLDAAVPCGLIINELVMNCVKHAFPRGRKGNLWISMGSTADNRVELRVRDNGVGFPPGHNIDNPQTLGLTIVSTLVRQLRGRMEIRNDGGGEIKVVFPVSFSRRET